MRYVAAFLLAVAVAAYLVWVPVVGAAEQGDRPSQDVMERT